MSDVVGLKPGERTKEDLIGRSFAVAGDRSRTLYCRVKRLIDIIVCVVAMPAIVLLISILALIIMLSMGRPILFSQPRTGLGGKIFRMYKLRTMINAGYNTGLSSATIIGDPRITRVGRLLRQSHLDELPQFWNVLRGEMTLIGPRPEQPHLVQTYAELLPNYQVRHSLRPGLSGWAQVKYGYAARCFGDRNQVTS